MSTPGPMEEGHALCHRQWCSYSNTALTAAPIQLPLPTSTGYATPYFDFTTPPSDLGGGQRAHFNDNSFLEEAISLRFPRQINASDFIWFALFISCCMPSHWRPPLQHLMTAHTQLRQEETSSQASGFGKTRFGYKLKIMRANGCQVSCQTSVDGSLYHVHRRSRHTALGLCSQSSAS